MPCGCESSGLSERALIYLELNSAVEQLIAANNAHELQPAAAACSAARLCAVGMQHRVRAAAMSSLLQLSCIYPRCNQALLLS